MYVQSLCRVQLFETPWTVAYQAPLSMDFLGKNTGLDCYPFSRRSSQPRDCFLHRQVDSLPLGHLGSPFCIIYKSEKNCLFFFCYCSLTINPIKVSIGCVTYINKQQKFMSHHSGGLEIRVPALSGSGETFFWVSDSHFFTVSLSHGGESSKRGLWGLFYKGTNPIHEGSTPMKIQHRNLGRTQILVHNRRIFSIYCYF